MAPRTKIIFDKTEIVVMDTSGKKAQVLNLTYEKIVSIQFDATVVKQLFSSKPTEKITITIRGREKPLVFFKHQEASFFDEYKVGLEKFAKDNRVSFRNNLPL